MDNEEKMQAIPRLTPAASLQQTQAYLVKEAKGALRQPSFEARNKQMAVAVGHEASLLAARSIGRQDLAERLELGFTQASSEAGETFAPAFDPCGNPRPDQEAALIAAMDTLGVVAYRHLPEVLEAAGNNVDAKALLSKVNFTDVLRLTARELGQLVPQELTPEQVKQSLHETATGDWLEDQIDSLPFGDGTPLSPQQEQALDVALRLANATWKQVQVHLAVWDGNDSRIDPAQREGFNPYDVLKQVQYDRLIQAGRTLQEALIRVAFEVYKDKIQYDSLL